MKIITETNFYLKNVPRKFEPIKEQIPDLVLFEEKKRLTPEKRKILNKALLQHFYSDFLNELKINQPHVFYYIKGSKPVKILRVTRRDGSNELQILHSDNKKIRCSKTNFSKIDFINDYQY